EWATCIGPAKRLGCAIEVIYKVQNLRPQVVERGEVAALDHPTNENRKPDFDLIEPRRMLGNIHELNTVCRVTQKGRPTAHRLQHPAFAFLAQIGRRLPMLREHPHQRLRLMSVHWLGDEQPARCWSCHE